MSIADVIQEQISAAIPSEMMRNYRGVVVSQNPSNFACNVQVPDMGLTLENIPWYLSSCFLVPSGAQCMVAFDSRNQAFLIAVNETSTTEFAALGTKLQALITALVGLYNTHTHAVPGSETATPDPAFLYTANTNVVSTTDKVRE